MTVSTCLEKGAKGMKYKKSLVNTKIKVAILNHLSPVTDNCVLASL